MLGIRFKAVIVLDKGSLDHSSCRAVFKEGCDSKQESCFGQDCPTRKRRGRWR